MAWGLALAEDFRNAGTADGTGKETTHQQLQRYHIRKSMSISGMGYC